MRNERSAMFYLAALALDVLVIALVFFFVVWARATFPEIWPWDFIPGEVNTLESFPPRAHLQLLIPILPLWLGGLQLTGAYRGLYPESFTQQLARVTSGVGLGFLTLVLLAWSFQQHQFSRTLLVGFLVASWPALLASHWLLAMWQRRGRVHERNIQQVLVIGQPEDAQPLVMHLAEHPELPMRLMGLVIAEADPEAFSTPLPTDHGQGDGEPEQDQLPVLGTLDDLADLLAQRSVHQVFMVGWRWDTSTLRQVAAQCGELGVRFSFNVSFLGVRLGRAQIQELGGWTTLCFSQTPTDAVALLFKRVFDVLASGLGLLALSPLLGLVALIIKLQDGGPVLFEQKRSGLYGRPFGMLKFRSMVLNAEALRAELEAQNEMDGPVFKIKRDPRITPIGAFIRKTSIDELPQLWNVLRGDMSLVGPRPPIPAEVEQYERWQMRRLSMKPGITCIWQVSGRNQISFEDWMKLDLQYIDNWSFWLDIKLLLLTAPVVLLQRGAS
jgi:exopolysaccharide biosynthesis polyprenyl glycosylphosphotransferase